LLHSSVSSPAFEIPGEAASHIAHEIDFWKKVITDAGIRLE
jgi:hypothetical protein